MRKDVCAGGIIKVRRFPEDCDARGMGRSWMGRIA